MVDGALFDQCKSDKGDEMIASCGKAGMERRWTPKTGLPHQSTQLRLISHIYTVHSHDPATSEHKSQFSSGPVLSLNASQVCARSCLLRCNVIYE